MPIDDQVTHSIIGAAMEVHNILGTGFQEVIYQRALAIELEERGIEFRREQEMPIFFKDHEVGMRRADFIIDGNVLVELKALVALEDVHLAQGLNYLKAYRLPVGLLINFGAMKLEFKRLFRKD
jgi:GxxExxY protein